MGITIAVKDKIIIECINCASTIDLDARTYANYTGDIICFDCEKILNLQISDKELLSTPKIITKIIKIPNLPKSIEKDLTEAQSSFENKSYRASTVMCRRALEQICHHLDSVGNTLNKKIQDLISRGLVSREFSEIFTKIRIFGNIGAHFDPDEIKDIKRQDSKDLLDITLHIARHIYEVEAILKRLRKRKSQP